MTVRSEHIKVQTIYKRNLFDDQINAKLNDFKIDVTLEIICVYNCGWIAFHLLQFEMCVCARVCLICYCFLSLMSK